MPKYRKQDAAEELRELGVKLLAKAQRDASERKVVELAKMYAVVRRESEKLEDSARMLRLLGTLEPSTYKQLAEGYDALGKGILEIAKSQWLTGDVYILGNTMKNSVGKKWSSLAEYIRSEAKE